MSEPAVSYVPTCTNVTHEGDTLVLETLDPDRESDIVSTEDGLERRGNA